MKKKPVTTTTHELGPLITEVRNLIQSARHAAATTVNTLQVLTNFEIGRHIVEHEQQGEQRAAYGKELLADLAQRLSAEFGNGFSRSNIAYMRSFYLAYQDRPGANCPDSVWTIPVHRPVGGPSPREGDCPA